jgi:hypothetical protein
VESDEQLRLAIRQTAHCVCIPDFLKEGRHE